MILLILTSKSFSTLIPSFSLQYFDVYCNFLIQHTDTIQCTEKYRSLQILVPHIAAYHTDIHRRKIGIKFCMNCISLLVATNKTDEYYNSNIKCPHIKGSIVT